MPLRGKHLDVPDALCEAGRLWNEVCTLQEMAVGQADTVLGIGCSQPNLADSERSNVVIIA